MINKIKLLVDKLYENLPEKQDRKIKLINFLNSYKDEKHFEKHIDNLLYLRDKPDCLLTIVGTMGLTKERFPNIGDEIVRKERIGRFFKK